MKRKVGLLLAVAFGAATVFLAWRAYLNSPVQQLKREIERLKKEGEPVSVRDLVPPVPSHLDGTPYYQQAIAQLGAVPEPAPLSLELFSLSPPQPINRAEIARALQMVQPALKTLRHAVSYPHLRLADWSRFEENPIAFSADIFPHFARFRRFTRLLMAEAFWRKQQGDMDGAMESCVTALRLTRRLGDEPTLIGFLVQSAMFAITAATLEWLLDDKDASAKAYRALLAELRTFDIDRDAVRSLQMERAMALAFYDSLSKASVKELLPLNDKGEINLALLLSKRSVMAQTSLEMLAHMGHLIAIARKGPPYDWTTLRRLGREVESHVNRSINLGKWKGYKVTWRPFALLRLWVATDAEARAKQFALFHARHRLAMVAIALWLYRHEHGRYLENLQALVPRYLPQVPLDPFDGRPLRYQHLKSGFKLWSVGPNLKDDGGLKTKQWPLKGDIVWTAAR